MRKIKIGMVDYLNCLPVVHCLENGEVNLNAEIIKGPPSILNKQFKEGKLDITPISSIEYARDVDKCVILPNMSISADGRVASILLFSKVPITELEGKTICLTSSSATSVVLLKILLEHYYHVNVNYVTKTPDLKSMLEEGEAALLIGDDALEAHNRVMDNNEPLYVQDLGEAWKEFTGEKMVFALWVIREDFAAQYPNYVGEIARAMRESKELGMQKIPELVASARSRSSLSDEQLIDYFHTIKHNFSEDYRRALLTFYDYAYKSGLINERVKLRIWGEDSWPVSVGF